MRKKVEVSIVTLVLIALFACATLPFILKWYVQSSYYKNMLIATDAYTGVLRARLDFNEGIRRIYILEKGVHEEYTGNNDGVVEVWIRPISEQDSIPSWAMNWIIDSSEQESFIDAYNRKMRYLMENYKAEQGGGESDLDTRFADAYESSRIKHAEVRKFAAELPPNHPKWVKLNEEFKKLDAELNVLKDEIAPLIDSRTQSPTRR